MILRKIALTTTALFISAASVMPAFAFEETKKGDWSGTTGKSTYNAQDVARISKEELKLKEKPSVNTTTEISSKAPEAEVHQVAYEPSRSNLSLHDQIGSIQEDLLSFLFKFTPLLILPALLSVLVRAFRS